MALRALGAIYNQIDDFGDQSHHQTLVTSQLILHPLRISTEILPFMNSNLREALCHSQPRHLSGN
jgi:hypothetical protein